MADHGKYSSSVFTSVVKLNKVSLTLYFAHHFRSSHWYECPNGHPYFIGECGGAMQISHCIECNEVIGGSGHTLIGNNRPAAGIVRDILNG